jgi:uncharacterized sulfatase
MTMLDDHIGAVVEALPSAVAQNTIIVFLADHGDYAGAFTGFYFIALALPLG